ncbi:hypothetical protein GW17_00055368 [Ensete ventricosum]|nr:hypothetical protein GW17_00055368 [Ensete ventricosum]
MRLNRVESFYAFLSRFRSEGNKEEGQQGMARPLARGRLAPSKAPLQRGGRLRLNPLQGAATRRGNSRPQARPTAARPQGAAAARLQGGDGDRRGGKERARASF